MINKLYRIPGQTILVATQKLWKTKDGRLVLDGEPDAEILFCAPGQQVAFADAEKFGIYGGDRAAEVPAEPIAEVKPVEPESKPIWPAQSRRSRRG